MIQKKTNTEKIILGIDPGTNVMGYGILGINGKKPQLVAMGVIKLSKFDDHYMRLRRIYERVSGLVKQYLPDEILGERFYEPTGLGYEETVMANLKKLKGQ